VARRAVARAKEPSKKAVAWPLFDALVTGAHKRHENPWKADATYAPDFDTLKRLLGVPLYLEADTTSGVPALALDVWVAYELRRAGLGPDWVWPREEAPRVVARDVIDYTNAQYVKTKKELWQRLRKGDSSFGSTVGASANLLGKNYMKQVDVIMTHWATGPEIMISTKRMDSSFGKNAANRVEESYGDAKNLRLRHPQAACGFVYGLRSTCFDETPDKFRWLVDLLTKLGREEDAYHAVALLVPEYDNAIILDATVEDPAEEAPVGEPTVTEVEPALPLDDVEQMLSALPSVDLRHDLVPEEVSPARFFKVMLSKVLDHTPIDFHVPARRMRGDLT
jgi:hypothetical protein